MKKLEIFKLAFRQKTRSIHTVSTSTELIHYHDSLKSLAPRSYPVSYNLLMECYNNTYLQFCVIMLCKMFQFLMECCIHIAMMTILLN